MKEGQDFIKDPKGALKVGKAFEKLQSLSEWSKLYRTSAVFFTVAERAVEQIGGIVGCRCTWADAGCAAAPTPLICSQSKKIHDINIRIADDDSKGEARTIQEDTKSALDLAGQDIQAASDKSADKLMEVVSGMSDGWWEQQGDAMRTSVSVFLTGEAGGTTAAGHAQDYRDMVDTKAQYGKDFTAALKTIVTVWQEMSMIAAQRRANEHTMGAIKEYRKAVQGQAKEKQWQKQLLAMQITESVVTLQDTLRTACQSLAYQIPAQYFKCMADQTPNENDFVALCGSFENGVTPISEPFLVPPEPFASGTEMAVEVYFQRVLEALGYESFQGLSLVVEGELWYSQTEAALPIVVKEFKPPDPSTTMVDTKYNRSVLLLCNTSEVQGEEPNPVVAGDLSCINEDSLPLPPDSTLACCRIGDDAMTVESAVNVTELPRTPYATSADWAEFKRTGKLSFHLGHDSVQGDLDGCGTSAPLSTIRL